MLPENPSTETELPIQEKTTPVAPPPKRARKRKPLSPLAWAWHSFKHTPFAKFWVAVYYSMPIQLLVSQIRSHKSLLIFWSLIFLLLNQQIAQEFGGAYLVLEPEYMNAFDFASMFLLGVSFGIFILAYQLTSYILDGYRFFFLGLEKKPFLKFSINNSLIPVAFWINYAYCFLKFQSGNPLLPSNEALWLLSGAVLGGVFITIISLAYFTSTNQDIFKLFGETIISEFRPRKAIIRSARRSMNHHNIRVDYFFQGIFRIKAAQNNVQADFRKLVKVLDQNHSNALLVELFLLIVLFIVGLFQHTPQFRIPAGASFLLLFAFFIMMVGALSYWFRQIGLLSAILLIGVFYFLNNSDGFVGKNYAYGLDYNQKPAGYCLDSIKQHVSRENYLTDSLNTIQILENWKAKYQKKYGTGKKPKMVFLCTTGGGVRSAVWTVKCLQTVDQQINGKLSDHVRLITGASGGMMGAAYYRELMLMKSQNPDMNMLEQKYVENISKDLLNPIILNMTTTLLMPQQLFPVQDGANRYESDRGYAMELQFAENTQAIFDKRLGAYKEPEQKAEIPMMIFTPSILNDGRQLVISPQGVSYLCTPLRFNQEYANEIFGVEFSRFFRHHNPMNLRFTTAVRMSATFPTIMPFVEMPTNPRVLVLDAGLIDNFGVFTATKFLYAFRDWIQENTSGVVLLQIRDSKRETEPSDPGSRSMVNKISGLGSAYNTFTESKDFINDFFTEYTNEWYKGKFDVLELQYIPSNRFAEASLNFHLTQREKDDVVESIHNPENKKTIAKLKELLEE